MRAHCYRSQLPMTLTFAVTHHKSQGDTLDRVVLDIGEREINDGQTFIALRRCRDINNMLLEDFSKERLQAIGNSASFPARLAALDRIRSLEYQTQQRFGLPPLTREPRPPRPPTAGRRGAMGRGWASRGARGTVAEGLAEGPERGAQDGPVEWPAGVATAGAEHPQSEGHVGEDSMDAQKYMEETAGGRRRGSDDHACSHHLYHVKNMPSKRYPGQQQTLGFTCRYCWMHSVCNATLRSCAPPSGRTMRNATGLRLHSATSCVSIT